MQLLGTAKEVPRAEKEAGGGRRKEEARSEENAVGLRKRTLSAGRGSGQGRSMWERGRKVAQGSRVRLGADILPARILGERKGIKRPLWLETRD